LTLHGGGGGGGMGTKSAMPALVVGGTGQYNLLNNSTESKHIRDGGP